MTHHYKIAEQALETVIRDAAESGWSEPEVLQSILVAAIERHTRAAGAQNTRSVLEFEMSNLSDDVDYDFVRSR